MNVRPWNQTRMGLFVNFGLFVLLLLAAHHAGEWIMDQLDIDLRPGTEPLLHRTLMLTMIVYICLMALPFVPGIEIGLSLMVMFGAAIVPLVYLSTVVALVLAFLLGRLVPQDNVLQFLEIAGFSRLRGLLIKLEPLDTRQRLDFLLQQAPARWLPLLLRYRFLAVAAVLNTPGNTVVGGGGGISFLAGYSRLFTVRGYALTVALAVAPVPLAVLLSSI